MKSQVLKAEIYQVTRAESQGRTIRVSDKLWVMLDDLARSQGISRNRLIRSALGSIVENQLST